MRDQGQVETGVVDALIALEASFASLPDAELLVAIDELAARRRAIDAAIVRAAAEAAARSDHRPADESLVRCAGYGSVERMLQAKIGVRWSEAKQLRAVASATSEMVAISGGTIPIRYPEVAAALAQGWLSVPQAHAITSGLDKHHGRASAEDVEDAERLLVSVGCGTHVDDVEPAVPETLTVLAKRCLDHIDPDGDEPRYEQQLADRYLAFTRSSRGGYDIRGHCTDDQQEVIAACFDAEVKPRRVVFEDACGATDEPVLDADGNPIEQPIDDRTMEQRRLDAFVAIVNRHAEASAPRICGEAPTLTITVAADVLAGQPATTLEDLPTLSRTGETVPVSIAARYLCDSFVQILVQDDAGQPLRMGRKRRLFSKSQRRAIVARDRHCRAPGCTAPPGWCETHHVTPWSYGGDTDVDNGILLCQHHHTELHRGALTITRAPQPTITEPADHPTDPSTPPTTRGRRPRTRPRRWRVTSAYPRRHRTRTPLRR
ncbi:HNH endonuclease signature motif containing protein [Agrococcus jejuensis]|uniref:HNH endonuclease n=1 Tax=Agrococcus jejuensis TaxID=399736 RepID=A0A1G8FP61_9MICO|nr:HNH endonuclease signature motif containing protein [Agrococcus jejuensis]SDH83847.1 HNH endonuclease [Agrococcus jejuensis]